MAPRISQEDHDWIIQLFRPGWTSTGSSQLLFRVGGDDVSFLLKSLRGDIFLWLAIRFELEERPGTIQQTLANFLFKQYGVYRIDMNPTPLQAWLVSRTLYELG